MIYGKGELLLQGGVLLWVVFVLTLCAELWLIPRLRARRAGQPILEIGPHWHLSKAGTPTMGGLGFLFAVALATLTVLLFGVSGGHIAWREVLLIVLFALACGGIGVLDDRTKLSRQKNEGLSAAQKYLLQLLASGAFLYAATVFLELETSVLIPFFKVRIELGFFYYPLALFYLTGLVNALNLTDGVDGLLSATTGVFSAFLVVASLLWGHAPAMLVGAMLLGAVLAFLCFNAHPAKVFMGDTGSLFLGAMVAGYGILSPSPLLVLIAGGVFVIEALSVILQVVWFKLSHGKRLFRMAPLHHHFEKLGWSENRVVGVFSLVGALLAIPALIGG